MVRGVDQTGRAFRAVDQNIEKMIQRQMQLHGVSRKVAKQMIADQIKVQEQLQRLDTAMYRLMFAGAAFIAFAGMIAWGLGNIIEKSSAGSLLMEDFSRVWEKLSISISEAIMEYWGPALTNLVEWLDELAENETFKMVVGKAAIPVVITLGVMGVTLLMVAIVGKFMMLLLSGLVAAGFISAATKATIMTTAAGLGFKIFVPVTVALGLTIVLEWVKSEIERTLEEIIIPEEERRTYRWVKEKVIPRKTVSPVSPERDKTVIDWLVSLFTGKQLGTIRIPRTMPIMAHEGEMIFNPQLPITPPLQMRGMGVHGPIIVNLNQYVDTVHTEADIDVLASRTAQAVGDKLTETIGDYRYG